MQDTWDDIQNFITDIDESIRDAVLLFLGTLVILFFIKNRIVFALSKFTRKGDNHIESIILKELRLIPSSLLFFISLYAAFTALESEITNNTVVSSIQVLFFTILGFQLLQFTAKVIRRLSKKVIDDTSDSTTKSVYHYLSNIGLVVLWVVGIIFVVSNLGYDVTAIVTGLGISGFAIAFGLRKIIFDLFASVVIILDKPFKIGDYIVIKDTHQGTVKKIGIRSIRLKSRDKADVVVPNSEVVSKAVINYKTLKRTIYSFDIAIVKEDMPEVNPVRLFDKAFAKQATELIHDYKVYKNEVTDEVITIHIDVTAKIDNNQLNDTTATLQNVIDDTLKKYELVSNSIKTEIEPIT